MSEECKACLNFEKKYDDKPAAIRWYSLHHALLSKVTKERDEARAILKKICYLDYAVGTLTAKARVILKEESP